MTILNFGLDEAGKISDNYIYFARVEIDEKDEQDLFINILFNTDDFLYSKEILNNLKTKRILKLCNNLLDKNLVKVKFYKLSPIVQNKILNDVFRYQALYLFRSRFNLIDMFDKEKINKGRLNAIIRQLHHYRKYSTFPDYSMKSYAFLNILNEMCNNPHICEFLKKKDNYINVQIDGGHFFSFWWYDLINFHQNIDIIRNKLFIRGSAHGDECYLPVNIADLFSRAFQKKSLRFFDYEIIDIKYDFRSLPVSNDTFFRKFWSALSKNIFKKRVLMIGKSELFNLLIHVMHRKNRKINYEPFQISSNIEYFFKNHSTGYPQNNIAVFGDTLNDIDTDNIKICESIKIETCSIIDFQDDFFKFFDLIEKSVESYDSTIKSKIKEILRKKREYFER